VSLVTPVSLVHESGESSDSSVSSISSMSVVSAVSIVFSDVSAMSGVHSGKYTLSDSLSYERRVDLVLEQTPWSVVHIPRARLRKPSAYEDRLLLLCDRRQISAQACNCC